jgi:DNA-binding XRE family transcriptional regulator
MSIQSDRLEKARIRAGFDTASDAARAMDIPVQTYLAHENGSRAFDVATALKYARKFQVPVGWLAGGAGEPSDTPIERIYSELTPEAQKQALDYLKFLKSQSGLES